MIFCLNRAYTHPHAILNVMSSEKSFLKAIEAAKTAFSICHDKLYTEATRSNNYYQSSYFDGIKAKLNKLMSLADGHIQSFRKELRSKLRNIKKLQSNPEEHDLLHKTEEELRGDVRAFHNNWNSAVDSLFDFESELCLFCSKNSEGVSSSRTAGHGGGHWSRCFSPGRK